MSVDPAAPPVPAGADHPAVRRFSAARRNLLPREDLVVAVAGPWAHTELLRLGGRIETLLHGPDVPAGSLLERLVRAADARYLVSARTVARLSPEVDPHGLLSLVRLPPPDRGVLTRPAADLVLVADGVGYAGNLGTLIRTADACGVAALLLTGASVRLTHPKVFVASRGTVLTLPVAQYADAAAARSTLAAAGWRCVVADPQARRCFTDHDFRGARIAVVVGSERSGVADAWRQPAADLVSIPMLGRADSLNVAISAAMLLAEVRRQRTGVDSEPR